NVSGAVAGARSTRSGESSARDSRTRDPPTPEDTTESCTITCSDVRARQIGTSAARSPGRVRRDPVNRALETPALVTRLPPKTPRNPAPSLVLTFGRVRSERQRRGRRGAFDEIR